MRCLGIKGVLDEFDVIIVETRDPFGVDPEAPQEDFNALLMRRFLDDSPLLLMC